MVFSGETGFCVIIENYYTKKIIHEQIVHPLSIFVVPSTLTTNKRKHLKKKTKEVKLKGTGNLNVSVSLRRSSNF